MYATCLEPNGTVSNQLVRRVKYLDLAADL